MTTLDLSSTQSSVLEGLTSAEAAERLQKFGPNAVEQKRPSKFVALIRKFWGVVPWMLELAVILDLVLGRWVEAGVIFALLVFNAVLGYFQENRAQQALALLRQRLTVTARVQRDSRWQEIPASQLVPDDLIHVRVGDIVPADVRLTSGEIQVDQSQLTGESQPVDCGPGSTAFAGSLVNRGEATGVVTATGTRTSFGKTAALVGIAEPPHRLELLILKITQYLAAFVILLAVAVFVATLIRGISLLEMLPFGLMLLVAAVPITLPAMFTMSAALGARGLAQNGILATRLSALQDAASMDVICLDKTGTITQNHLTVEHVEPLDSSTTPDDVLRMAALASAEVTQDPIDLAILQQARERGLSANPDQHVEFLPFDPSTKRTEAVLHQGEQEVHIIKGAPSVIAELVHQPWDGIAAEVERLSAGGARVLAVATGSKSDLHIAGLIALGDPPRPESPALIKNLLGLGMRVLMVTGDGEATARAVAAQVGITGEVAPPGTLREGLDAGTVEQFGVFAGVRPEDKYYLVQALQKAGHVVGMTGDGVNDAPALRQADVGIAVANSTDVARTAAGLVLTRPGISEIVMAINGSRRVYQRMVNFVLTMMTRKLGIPLFLTLGVVLLGVFVLNPLLIVLLMFATDVATMTLSTDQVVPSPSPNRWRVGPLLATALSIAIFFLLLCEAVFWLGQQTFGLGLAQLQTLVFVWVVFAGTQAVLYLTRNRGFFWEPPFPGRWVLLTTLLDIGVVTLMAAAGWLMAPISLVLIGYALALAILFLIVADLIKVAFMPPVARVQGS